MARALEEMQKTITFNSQPFYIRLSTRLWEKKWRFIFMGLFALAYNKWGSPLAKMKARKERSVNKYKKRWLNKYNPSAV